LHRREVLYLLAVWCPENSLDPSDLLKLLLNQVSASVAVEHRNEPPLPPQVDHRLGDARPFDRHDVLYAGSEEEYDVGSTLHYVDHLGGVDPRSRRKVLRPVAHDSRSLRRVLDVLQEVLAFARGP